MSAIFIKPRIFVEQVFVSRVRKTPYNFCNLNSVIRTVDNNDSTLKIKDRPQWMIV